MVFVWACGRKGRALTGEWDHLPTRSGFNQGPLLVVRLGLVGTRIRAGFCDHRWVGRELRLSRPVSFFQDASVRLLSGCQLQSLPKLPGLFPERVLLL